MSDRPTICPLFMAAAIANNPANGSAWHTNPADSQFRCIGGHCAWHTLTFDENQQTVYGCSMEIKTHMDSTGRYVA